MGFTTLSEYIIDTSNARHLKHRRYRIHLSTRDQTTEMRKNSITEPDHSWCSPIVVAAKKYGSVLFCCFYHNLSEIDLEVSQQLQRIDDTLNALSMV